ncbi:ferritin-like domain-containing protein [Lactifluus volemus]|nr:ferritin-like domain-containing protein [Lactifluus volemus]
MLFFQFLAVLVPLAVSAVPVRRASVQVGPGTLVVLQLANVLENLETLFYQQVLAKFKAADYVADGFPSGPFVTDEITRVENDEAIHQVIKGSGAIPLECQFNLGNLLTDVKTAMNAARLLEEVGVSAYTGAVNLIDSQDANILVAAATIVTIESRHQTIFNILNGHVPSSQHFDLPLLPTEVVTVAGPLISGCDLGIPSNTPLALTNNGTITTGTLLQFSSPALTGDTSKLLCQILTGDQNSTVVLPLDKCIIPPALDGPAAVFITNTSVPLSNDILTRQNQNNTIVAGPTLTFIDSVRDELAELVTHAGQKQT